jgi:hypothetical protein
MYSFDGAVYPSTGWISRGSGLLVSSAHNQCACHLHAGGPWESNLSGCPYGLCATCGKFRGLEKEQTPRDDTNRLMQTIPIGGRDSDVMAVVRRMWKEHRVSKADR